MMRIPNAVYAGGLACLCGWCIYVGALALSVFPFWAEASYALDRRNLRHRAEYLLGQDTTSTNKQFEDGELNFWIDDGVRFVSKVALCVERETTFVITPNITDYTMPSDFIQALGVVFSFRGRAIDLTRSPRGLNRSIPNLLGKQPTGREGGPVSYQDLGETVAKLRFTPVPIVKDTARVSYAAYGNALDLDTSTCDLPEAYQTLIATYAAWKAYTKTRLPNPYKATLDAELSLLGLEPATRPQDPVAPSESP